MRVGFGAIAVSLELMPKVVLSNDFAELAQRIAPRTRIFLPHLPGQSFRVVAEAAARVQAANLQPVPHIAARRWTSQAEFLASMRQLQGAIGEKQHLLLIGGSEAPPRGAPGEASTARSPPPPQPAFPTSLALLQSGTLAQPAVDAISLAAHPGGLDGVPAAELTRAMELKVAAIHDLGIHAEAVTQFHFGAEAIVHAVELLSEMGVDHVAIGIPGPSTQSTMEHYAKLCSVAPPKVWDADSPAALIHDVYARLGDELCHPDRVSFHVFPFGGAKRVVDWLKAEGLDSGPHPPGPGAKEPTTTSRTR